MLTGKIRGSHLASGFPREAAETRRAPRCEAFSLVELLIVLALLIIMTVMYWGRSSGSRQRALQAACQRNLQQVYVVTELYATENRGSFPVQLTARTPAEALAVLVPKYTSETRSFICPGVKDPEDLPAKSFARQKISYAYYMGQQSTNANELLLTDAQVNSEAKAAGDLVFSATGKGPGSNHHRFGGNLVYSDGRVVRTGTNATSPMPLNRGIVLLNP
jgi:type II secretory pathway pseudopilin PulG